MALFFGIATVVGTYLTWIQRQEARAREGWSPELRATVNDVLNGFEAARKPDNDLGDLRDAMSEQLKQDPYNIPALLGRAMAFHVEGEYRQAITDFERAAAANKRLGDTHFGLGMILYELAIFDLVKRGRYEIRGNGTLGFDPQRGVVVKKAPDLSVAPDDRSKLLLQSALEEFEKGQILGQYYRRLDHGSADFYSQQHIQTRVEMVRRLLGYQPWVLNQDFLMKFWTFLAIFEPDKAKELLKAEKE